MSLASFYKLPLLKGSFLILPAPIDWRVGLLTLYALWNLCVHGIFLQNWNQEEKLPWEETGGRLVGRGSNCQVYFRELPPPGSSSRLVCLYKLVASSNTLLVWARMYPGRLTAFPLPSNCPFPTEDSGFVGAFSTLADFSPVLPFHWALAICKVLGHFIAFRKATDCELLIIFNSGYFPSSLNPQYWCPRREDYIIG